MSLRQHVKKWKSCDRCPIASKHKVFYRGSPEPLILFIGEAPGTSEVVTKKPFTGPAGKIFDALVRSVHLSEGQFGVTNTICCFPSQKTNALKFRKPEKEELENCRERLDDLTECVTPNYYIALGKVAKQNPPTGVTYHLELDHPSYILRSGGVKSIQFKRNKHKLRKFLKGVLSGKETKT